MNLDLAVWILSGLNQSEFLNRVLNLAKRGPHGALRTFGDLWPFSGDQSLPMKIANAPPPLGGRRFSAAPSTLRFLALSGAQPTPPLLPMATWASALLRRGVWRAGWPIHSIP